MENACRVVAVSLSPTLDNIVSESADRVLHSAGEHAFSWRARITEGGIFEARVSPGSFLYLYIFLHLLHMFLYMLFVFFV